MLAPLASDESIKTGARLSSVSFLVLYANTTLIFCYSSFRLCSKSKIVEMGLCNTVSQIYPPKPKFTENELPNLAGKVRNTTKRVEDEA